ncbi:MAG: AAA family ATPase [Pirellulaceae bacterium]|nr:AAA family ATPase [Pirellulaceae bacterium]
MFTRIQTRLFRCLKSVDQRLGPFRALVGPNASGKTTFLDCIGLLADLMRNRGYVVPTLQARSPDFCKLVWMECGEAFQLAVEAEIPPRIRPLIADDKRRFESVRYEVEFGLDRASNELGLNHETLWLQEPAKSQVVVQRDMFPFCPAEAPEIFARTSSARRVALKKRPGGNDNFYPEGKDSYKPSYPLGRGRSALAEVPADEESFPVSNWFRGYLEQGVQSLVLNSQTIRRPSPPGLGNRFQPNGSNLPWVIAELRKSAARFEAWLRHVRTALDDIRDIRTVERPEDKHCYLVIEYENGANVPSWLVSDGTLRLLALTIPAYLEGFEGTFLIEEPENGIHPRAIETVLQSLSSMYHSQVLIATHSPVALDVLSAEDVLCFAKDSQGSGATDVVDGVRHPALRLWKRGEPDLGVLFASGILS